jgi:hypothetical protein
MDESSISLPNVKGHPRRTNIPSRPIKLRPMKTNTPETDADRNDVDTYSGGYLCEKNPNGEWVHYLKAQKLERERNAAYALLTRCRNLTGYSLELRAAIDAVISSENVEDRRSEAQSQPDPSQPHSKP